MKSIDERINEAVKAWNGEIDNIDKLIAAAYLIGRERATKEVSDKYNSILKAQIERANKCRYHKMALEVQGNVEFVYTSEYSGSISEMFGKDITEI